MALVPLVMFPRTLGQVFCGEAEGGNSYLTPGGNEINMTPKNHPISEKEKSFGKKNSMTLGFQ